GGRAFDRIWASLFAPDAQASNWIDDPGPPQTDVVDVPVLVMGGWYDIWSQDALAAFGHLLRTSPKEIARSHRLVMAPFGHGPGWVGEAPVPPDAMRFDCDLDLRWSVEWLHDRAHQLRDLDPVTFYSYGSGWRGSSRWPPPSAVQLMYFLDSAGGRLSELPLPNTSSASYTFDPHHPVPTRGGFTIGLPAGQCWQDGLDAASRADVLTFTTVPLVHDLDICGPVVARLFIESSAPDTDFTAKLLDVHPDGRALSICDGVVRVSSTAARSGAPLL